MRTDDDDESLSNDDDGLKEDDQSLHQRIERAAES